MRRSLCEQRAVFWEAERVRQDLASLQSSDNTPYLHPQMEKPSSLRQRGSYHCQLPDERGKEEKGDFQKPVMSSVVTEEADVTEERRQETPAPGRGVRSPHLACRALPNVCAQRGGEADVPLVLVRWAALRHWRCSRSWASDRDTPSLPALRSAVYRGGSDHDTMKSHRPMAAQSWWPPAGPG